MTAEEREPSSAVNEETLVEAFWGVARRLRGLSLQTLAPLEITPSLSRALGVLQRHGAMRLSELSDHLRIAARSTTEVIDTLEERGLVGRHPDPADRRATLVELTTAGDELNRSIRDARRTEAANFFGTLSAADRATLMQILSRLSAADPD
ncbi:DNA-binding MarR family transcriptional regulator [Jatrophihabitans sp. GAS493]|uniref:MarR family winged helix-turn-helix transcriptional regulator n=1 Tax=Jatrophihabitans sp. GAS493 TaxID=1907575 RepID=UPI000BB676F5|nr:MarR family transcriptional regulator [Jatrophihabitans sp. GAS493]SOD71417.1 DNA-binding MarR family transcriptional regulator [Jatrophihabitans sp. GAS493]